MVVRWCWCRMVWGQGRAAALRCHTAAPQPSQCIGGLCAQRPLARSAGHGTCARNLCTNPPAGTCFPHTISQEKALGPKPNGIRHPNGKPSYSEAKLWSEVVSLPAPCSLPIGLF